MNVIDISSYQSGIDLATIFKENPLDGVIIKASEATGYINPYFKTWAEWLTEHNKPWGTYHFCAGSDAVAEAKYFYSTIKRYIGKCIPCADYEADALKRGTGWLKEFLDEFYRLSGVKCLVYCSQSVTQSQNFSEIALDGYRLWMAQYADFSPVYGFKDNPWHRGSVAPFNGWQMHQYTSCGVLNGWKSYLDFDKFYGDENDWKALCGGEATPAPPSDDKTKEVDAVVIAEVLANRYGTENDKPSRSERLMEAGYDPKAVQTKINELYVIANNIKPFLKGNKAYINSIVKIAKQL